MKIERCVQADLMMERLRREAQEMSRDQLLQVVEYLSRLYATQRACSDWAVREAAANLGMSVQRNG